MFLIGLALTLPSNARASYTVEDQRAAADVVLENMRAVLPPGTMRMDGRLQVHDRRGSPVGTYELELLYNRSEAGLSIELLLSDAFGSLLEKIAVAGIGSNETTLEYFKGEGLERAEVPDLSAPILDTDFRWQDLTLSFLWWRGGKLTGVESVKGRECYVVQVPNPEAGPAGELVEMWIDSEMYVLLRARFLEGSKEIKRFDVKSFARTGDLWMVKDIDMRSFPSRRRSSFRVRNVEESFSDE